MGRPFRAFPRRGGGVSSRDIHRPGNVRELRNCTERAVIFNENGVLELQDLAFQYEAGHVTVPNTLAQAHNQLSREIIRDALLKSGGVKSKAAEMLKIHRKTLYNRMEKP